MQWARSGQMTRADKDQGGQNSRNTLALACAAEGLNKVLKQLAGHGVAGAAAKRLQTKKLLAAQ
jgi:hypothetical protein